MDSYSSQLYIEIPTMVGMVRSNTLLSLDTIQVQVPGNMLRFIYSIFSNFKLAMVKNANEDMKFSSHTHTRTDKNYK